MSAAQTKKPPTTAGHPPSTAPVAASRATPGVDHATVMGMRKRPASTMHPMPTTIEIASSPLAAWAGEAPTVRRPVSTTAKVLVKPTRAVTTPATSGRAREGAGVTVMGLPTLSDDRAPPRDGRLRP